MNGLSSIVANHTYNKTVFIQIWKCTTGSSCRLISFVWIWTKQEDQVEIIRHPGNSPEMQILRPHLGHWGNSMISLGNLHLRHPRQFGCNHCLRMSHHHFLFIFKKLNLHHLAEVPQNRKFSHKQKSPRWWQIDSLRGIAASRFKIWKIGLWNIALLVLASSPADLQRNTGSSCCFLSPEFFPGLLETFLWGRPENINPSMKMSCLPSRSFVRKHWILLNQG